MKRISVPLSVTRMEWQGRRIKAARALRHKSAQAVAAELEVSLSHYKRLESGHTNFAPGQLVVVSRLLDVPEPWLLREDFDPFGELPADQLDRIERKIDTLTSAPAQSAVAPGVRTSPDTLARRDILDTQPRPERSGEFQSTEQHPEGLDESQG